MNLDTKDSAVHQEKICIKMFAFALILGILHGCLAFDYNSIVDLNTPQMIKKYGYPVEKHQVSTDDGYELTMFRIPHGKDSDESSRNRPAVLVQHGLMCSSDDWLLLGPERSLATKLSDYGLDVWLGNYRGNRYSRHHKNLNTSDSKYWNFSWHENGYYDLPAMIDYIREKTHQDKIYYAGHSMGTTGFFVMASTRPEYNHKIKLMIALAPICHMRTMISPMLHLMAPATMPVGGLMKMMGVNEFTPSQELMKILGSTVCGKFPLFPEVVCKNILFLTCGFNPKQLEKEMLPAIMSHTPAGSSVSQFLHYGQEINDGKFKQYDFGIYNNLKKYQDHTPPDYKVEKISAPVLLIFGQNDWLAGLPDVDRLAMRLPNLVEKFKVNNTLFNHLDFCYGKDADTLVYPKMFEKIDEYAEK